MISEPIALLISKYLEGDILAEEMRVLEEWLHRDPAHLNVFIRQVDADIGLRKTCAATAESGRPDAPVGEKRLVFPRRRAAWWLSMAAAALATFGMALFGIREAGWFSDTVTVTAMTGEVSIQRGRRTFRLRDNESVQPRDRIRTLAGSSVTLALARSKTAIRMDPLTDLTLATERQSHALAAGRISVSTRPATGKAVAFATPNAEVQVVGTRFDLLTRERLTRVGVQEGVVALRSKNPARHPLSVPAGHVGVVLDGMEPVDVPLPTTQGLLALYIFKGDRDDLTIRDVSGVGDPMDLTIENPRGVKRTAASLQIRGKSSMRYRGEAAKLREAMRRSRAVTHVFGQDGPLYTRLLGADWKFGSFRIRFDKSQAYASRFDMAQASWFMRRQFETFGKDRMLDFVVWEHRDAAASEIRSYTAGTRLLIPPADTRTAPVTPETDTSMDIAKLKYPGGFLQLMAQDQPLEFVLMPPLPERPSFTQRVYLTFLAVYEGALDDEQWPPQTVAPVP
jgi:ferric-dicitrate binding protein FerR (iron transport regulator)